MAPLLHAIAMETSSMPITVLPSYREYARLLAEDRLGLEGAACPRPGLPIAEYG